MNTKFTEFKTEYNSLLSFVSQKTQDTDTQAAENFFIAAFLKIWAANVLYSPDYGTLVSEITGENYTIEQIVTAMGCCGDAERKLQVPDFFISMIRENKDEAADVIRKISDILVAAASINGDFTAEKAAAVGGILKVFTDHAYSAGCTVLQVPELNVRITERNESSYLQNDSLLEAVRQEKIKPAQNTQSGESIPTQSENPVNITINNINLGSDAVDKGTYEVQPDVTEESPAVSKPDKDENETMESLLEELDGLVGLENVKKDVHSLMNFIKVTKIRESRGMKVPTISYHLVFTGNPGTGKTTVARLVAKLYYHMGILPQGQLVETERSALVAGYLGQTAIKTQKVIQQAMGGVLFIDEAYSLAGDEQDSYGKEAIETILKAMEDHRDELVVIVAGYTHLMHKFIESNPGLSSRFSKYFEYPDYTGQELMAIFNRFCEKNGYRLAPEAAALLQIHFEQMYEDRDEHFGNARTARNIFEKAINAQADRIAVLPDITDADLQDITAADIQAAMGGAGA